MIVSTAEIETFLGQTGQLSAEQLAQLGLVHGMVERQVRRWLRTGVEEATYTHLLPATDSAAGRFAALRTADPLPGLANGHPGAVLALPEVPVRAIVSVHEDAQARAGQAAGSFAGETELAAGTDFYLDVDESGLSRSGHLIRIGRAWPAVGRSVRVSYTAGWTRDELDGEVASLDNPGLDASDLKLAVLYAVRHVFKAAGSESREIAAERLGDYSVRYADRAAAADLPDESRRLLEPFVRYGCR